MTTLIQQYASSVIAGFLARAEALRKLNHRLTKGELRELFVSEVLSSFLTTQFGVGSGIVVNQAGIQSRQTDIVIYDNRLLPPFIQAQRLGVFPAESVIATIEVKSRLTAPEVTSAASAALALRDDVYNPKHSIYPQLGPYLSPLCAAFGLEGQGPTELSFLDDGPAWLAAHANGLDHLCLAGRWSWRRAGRKWLGQLADGGKTHEEVKRFIGVLLDNVHTRAEARMQVMAEGHWDLLGVYIRDQDLFTAPEA